MKNILLSLLIITLLLATSCNSQVNTGQNETRSEAESTTDNKTAEGSGYVFPELNLNGETFTFMNPAKSTWGHYFDIDFKEETGETLDDAVYARNRKAEEMFNFKINVYEESIDTIHDTFTSAIMAGDDTYDAAYIRSSRFSLMPDSCTFMCIPVTNNDLENTALLLDALAYISFTDVLPVYYEVNVSQKGLRNDDSIEMLDIIRGYRVADIGACFGWSSSLQKTILNMIDNGSSDVVSTIESQRAKIESSIAESMSMFNN